MSVRPIVLLGDPRLRLKGQPVDSFGKYLHELLDDLAHTMRDAPGVGLAAPQLGEPLQAAVIEIDDQLHELVNPRIVRSDRRRPRPRGLSVDPGLRRLRHPPREGLGRRPGPPRQEDQGRRLGAPRTGAPARARPSRRQALHRLPRIDGRAPGRGRGERGRRRGPRGDERPGVTRRRRAGGARVPGPSSSAPGPSRSRSCDGLAARPDVELVGVVTRPGPPERPGAARPDADRRSRRRARELGVCRSCSRAHPRPRRRSRPSLRSTPTCGVLADYGQIVPRGVPGDPAPRDPQPPPVAPAAASGRDADPGDDPAGDRGHRRDAHPAWTRASTRVRSSSRSRGTLDGTETCSRARGRRRPVAGRSCSGGPSVRGSAGETDARARRTTRPRSLTRPLRREDGRLDPARPAADLERQVRANAALARDASSRPTTAGCIVTVASVAPSRGRRTCRAGSSRRR